MSDARVSLPDGPGSTAGVGENIAVSENMGAMTYGIPLELAAGFPGATPSLSLRYNSMGGNETVGVGWDLPVPHMERFTLRGQPHYDPQDTFAANGSEELVRVKSEAGERVYRARFEGGFVRYHYRGDAAGRAGYWVAEDPDGSRSFFGAYEDAEGRVEEVPAALARASDMQSAGVFRYMLVKTEDGFGHSVRYHYKLDCELDAEPDCVRGPRTPLLERIEYLFAGPPGSRVRPRYVVKLRYEKREDVIRNGLPGFQLALSRRLSAVEMFSNDTLMRRYVLQYEQALAGTSRLRRVRRFGVGGREELPLVFTFEYTSSLQLGCGNCAKPFVFSMGTLQASAGGGLDLENQRATLIDINGDALPDLVDTADGKHHFFLQRMDPDGSQRFSPPIATRLANVAGFQLEQPHVQVLDVNGDGLADMANAHTGEVLCNRGLGDWTRDDCPEVALGEVLVDGGGGAADPKGLRFFDANGDRKIDVLQAVAGKTLLWLNGNEGYEQVDDTDGLEFGFDDRSLLQLADINGDGLLDAAVVDGQRVWYRLHLGSGKFAPPRSILLTWADASAATHIALERWDLQDLNGDGLDDVVAVEPSRVYFALQRGGEFLPIQTLGSSDLGGNQSLPIRNPDTTVLFADMNGSGTTDVVWIDPHDSSVQVLELFAIRPNLLTRIENGLGAVQTVKYGNSVREQACDGAPEEDRRGAPYCQDRGSSEPWRYRLPQPVNLVVATTHYATVAPEAKLWVRRSYHHGFYDGSEKRYRGFAQVRKHVSAAPAATQQASLEVMTYDVGAKDPYRAGLLLQSNFFGERDGHRYPIHEVITEYERCELAEVESFEPSDPYPVGYPCDVSEQTVLQEGRPEREWVTTRTVRAYDGYGNVTLEANLGVVSIGEGAFEPCRAPAGTVSGACGPDGSGDEHYLVTEYVEPGPDTEGTWNLGSPRRIRRYGVAHPDHMATPMAGARVAETLMYYDGPAFVGRPHGLTAGLVTRVCQRVTPEAAADCRGEGWTESSRVERDPHGNVVTELDALGVPEDFSGHRRDIRYGPYGLKPEAITLHLARGGRAYQLTRTLHYEDVFNEPDRIGRWELQRAPVESTPAATRIAYDDFGRRSKIALPGDTLEAPTQTFRYELAAPLSRVIIQGRSVSGAESDLESIRCVDGLGRTLQTRTRFEEARYQVTDFLEFNPQGTVAKALQPYQGGRQCDVTRPSEVRFTSLFYDALGRPLRALAADHHLYAGASVTSFEYAPLQTTAFDSEDNNPDNPQAFHTPRRRTVDGLGRVILLERLLNPTGREGRVRALWDGLGDFVGYLDTHGNRKQQAHDLVGRVVEVHDPNAGRTLLGYDAAGNLRTRTDARGKTVETRYDGANRPLETFDPEDPVATSRRRIYDFAPECATCTHAEGRLAQAFYPLDVEGAWGSDDLGFDLRGQNTNFTRSLEGHRFAIARSFDNAGRVVAQRYPDGTLLTHRYDRASRPVGLDGVLEQVHYDARGQLSALHYANGVRTLYGYDELQRLQSLHTLGRRGAVLQSFKYTRDRVGNLTGVESPTAPMRKGVDPSVVYGHDAWYRTTQAHYTADGEVLDFGFDALDNLTDQESSFGQASAAQVGDYRYQESRPQAVRQAGSLSLDYDAAGQLTQRGGTTLTWDHRGRQVGARAQYGGQSRYAYALGVDRVLERHQGSVTYYVGPNFEVRDGISVTYARLGRQRIGRFRRVTLATDLLDDLNGNHTLDVGDAWLVHAESQGSPLGHLRGCARSMLLRQDEGPLWLHSDHLESLTLATTGEGRVRGQQDFFPTGQVRTRLGFVDTYGFTGQRVDPTTGLVHFRFRELDPATGRWASPDPLFRVLTPTTITRAGEATTAYAYVAGGFASGIDPSGLLLRRLRRPARRGSSRRPWGFHHRKENSMLYRPENVIGDTLMNNEGEYQGSIYYRLPASGGWLSKLRSASLVGRVTLGHDSLENNGREQAHVVFRHKIENVRFWSEEGGRMMRVAAESQRGRQYHVSRAPFSPATSLRKKQWLHATSEALGGQFKLLDVHLELEKRQPLVL